jgi:hypothetical protein
VHYDHFPVRGESHTYHDSTAGNSGAQYRNDDVDIACGPDSRYVVADLADGEWLSYTVYVPAAGDYPLSVAYSAGAGGGAVRVASAGADVTSEVPLPTTNGAVTSLPLGTAALAAGVQTLRVYFSGSLENVSFVQFSLGPR